VFEKLGDKNNHIPLIKNHWNHCYFFITESSIKNCFSKGENILGKKKEKKKKKKIDNLFTVKNMSTIVQQQVTEIYSIRFVKQFLIELSVNFKIPPPSHNCASSTMDKIICLNHY
jgi:hypothetical protein